MRFYRESVKRRGLTDDLKKARCIFSDSGINFFSGSLEEKKKSIMEEACPYFLCQNGQKGFTDKQFCVIIEYSSSCH